MKQKYVNYRDIPSDEPCWLVNSQLWSEFCYAFELETGKATEEQWSEAEVIQWLDIFDHEIETDKIIV